MAKAFTKSLKSENVINTKYLTLNSFTKRVCGFGIFRYTYFRGKQAGRNVNTRTLGNRR